MAIHCINPNTLSNEAEKLFNVASIDGKKIIDSFSTTINDLQLHWSGSDAVANLNELLKVYNVVAQLIVDLQKVIVKINNNEILPLQKHIVESGGSCNVGSELAQTLTEVPEITINVDSVVSYTEQSIIIDAEKFSKFPQEFSNFIENLIDAKDTLLKNWLDGAARVEVQTTFAKFEENKGDYIDQINQVKDNLNIVAKKKKQLM